MNLKKVLGMSCIVIIGVCGFFYFQKSKGKIEEDVIPVQNEVQKEVRSITSEKQAKTITVSSTGIKKEIGTKKTDSISQSRNTGPETKKKAAPIVMAKTKKLIEAKDGKGFLSPSFSPDGQSILFTSEKYNGLYLYNNESGETTQISDMDGVGYQAEILDDGTISTKKGVFDSSGELLREALQDEHFEVKNDNIYLKTPEGDNIALTSSEDQYFNPRMSPDGTKVAYQGLVGGIYIKDLASGAMTKVGQGDQPAWTPDGSGIVYSYTEDNGMNLTAGEIYYANASGNDVSNLTNTNGTIEINPQISPDGTKIIWNDLEGNIYVADLEDNS